MPIRHIPFFPDPIRGQALLDNFKRTLRYSGSDSAERLVRRGMPLYELETVESVGEAPRENPLADPACNLVIRGECLAACAALRDAGRTVDLVYIDPPFASGADYAKTVYLRRNPRKAAELTEAERTLESDELAAFEEKMYGDVWEKEKYLNWMYTNLLAIKSVMSDNASIYVHLDWHIVHYMKVMMDEIFGEECFQREIIWRIGWISGYKGSANNWIRNHDTILFYTNSDDYVFNKAFLPYPDNYTRRDGKSPEGNGYPVEDTWNCYELDRLDSIQIKSFSTEKVDYATQKPEALLERIIKASSNEGMTSSAGAA